MTNRQPPDRFDSLPPYEPPGHPVRAKGPMQDWRWVWLILLIVAAAFLADMARDAAGDPQGYEKAMLAAEAER